MGTAHVVAMKSSFSGMLNVGIDLPSTIVGCVEDGISGGSNVVNLFMFIFWNPSSLLSVPYTCIFHLCSSTFTCGRNIRPKHKN